MHRSSLPWLSSEIGLNAIAVLTNHPNKAPTRIHRNELPTVPRTYYPKIKYDDFKEYLSGSSALFEEYAANDKLGYQVAAEELNRYEAAVEDAERVLEIASHTYSMDSTTMAERLKTLDATRSEFGLDSISEYGGGTGESASARGLPGIEDVPTIFFEEDFDLGDPATFDIVTRVVLGPAAASTNLFSPENTTETNNAMQETLSGYMDVVEAYLTREISRRSPSFFAALSTLEELHSETDRCIQKIHVLRSDLKKTADTQCLPGLELIRLRRQRDNLDTVLSNIALLSSLQHTQLTIDELVNSGDYIGALNLLVEAQELVEPVYQQAQGLKSGQGPAADRGLVSTKAFGHLDTQMAKILHEVSSHAEREFSAIVLRDMREFLDDGLSNAHDKHLSTAQTGLLDRSQMDIYQANLALQLMPLVCGMARTGGIGSALKVYRDGLMSEATALVESLYPDGFPRSRGHTTFNDATQQRALGTAVRKQTFDQFCTLLRQQQELLLLVISHVDMVRRTVLQILDENAPEESVKAETRRSLNDTFEEFMDIAHMRCAKLLNHRSEQNARLSLAGFYALYTWIWQFVAKYESLGDKTCFGLRGTLMAQARSFLSNFHSEKLRQIQILIENEQWVQAEVPIDFQNLVNQVVEEPLTPFKNTDPGAGYGLLLARADSDTTSLRSVDAASIGMMHIGGSAFHVVGCSLVLVKSVVEYLQCAVSIPALATDILQRLVEVFKTFNSRSCQVVLGAGAMRSAGLKNISAKHLALASESLSLCMELIPHVRECLRRAMAAGQDTLLLQLDRATDDFDNHRVELHHKLVAIMAERANYHARVLGAIRWDELGHSTQPPVPAVEALVKEVRKLHKVLRRYLPPSTLRTVFEQIFAMYEPKLTAQYRKLRISTNEGKRQLMLNSQLLVQRLRALDPSLSVDWDLEVVVNNIDLVRPYRPSASAPGSPIASASAPAPDTLATSADPTFDPLSPTASEPATPRLLAASNAVATKHSRGAGSDKTSKSPKGPT
ncbi:Vps54-domain-containing protein [Coemansia reversa NRRL 1564]|uniref:Vacuolar protein sorting-associated protein 54 n=1 Tax=Coemansia reversa (strain ATCC 12441 / NRRL 1564) TaxID=763665 RepID=A0A2G5B9X9_COERN|nr:Vps54-domain-containing protein [Coemansia reversa NRRL 1564]|eukprot:PIA15826.1 Vps54-domain-containing protein [Coemansia reversa NRRL 1564]